MPRVTLTSTLREQTGLTPEELSAGLQPTPESLEPLESLLPPEGIVASRVGDVLARVRGPTRQRLDVAGVHGCAGAAIVAAFVRQGRRVVFVAQDIDLARRSADDVGFLTRGSFDENAEETGEGDVIVFAANESSPYAEVSPDRRAAMSRMATLFHLAQNRPWRVLIIPATALVRKVVPKAELTRRAD